MAQGTSQRGLRGSQLRAARERLGVTRVELAARSGRSLAAIAAIEGGAVPKRSRVLDEAFAALRKIEAENDHDLNGNEAVGKAGVGGAHVGV